MSFGFSVGDFITVGQLCWNIYKKCKDSSEDFKNLSSEVGSFHNVLKETEELLSEQKLSSAQEARLDVLKVGSEDMLKDLDKLLVKYESLGTNSKRTWDRMGFGRQDITALRLRLISQTTLLDAFNNASSHARLQQKLNLLITEIRSGKREGSIVSSRTFDSVAENDREVWLELRRELEDIGISPAILTEKRQFIITWFQEAIAAGGLEDSSEDDSLEDDFSGNNSDSASYEEAQPLSSALRQTPNQSTTNQTGLHQPTEQPEGNTLQLQMRKKKSQSRVSYLLKRLFLRDSKLIAATKTGNVIAVKELLDKGADVASTNGYGETALHVAALYDYEVVVRLLLEKGSDVAVATTSSGETALHAAAFRGNEAVVRLLLEKGADVAATDIYGRTALYNAASRGHEAVVRLLLEKGADVAATGISGETVLHEAASSGHEAVVRLLLEKGADVEATGITRVTALHMAASSGHEAVVRLLLEKGADVALANISGETALHEAASRGHEAVVRLLLEKDVDVAATTSTSGETALHVAASRGHKAVVRLLLKEGSDIEATDRSGRTALQLLRSR